MAGCWAETRVGTRVGSKAGLMAGCWADTRVGSMVSSMAVTMAGLTALTMAVQMDVPRAG